MKIKLIAPARKAEWRESLWDLKTFCKLVGIKAVAAPLVLPILASITPSDVEVILIDENVEPIDFGEKVDLVGITGMTHVVPRSYEIADEYKKRGVPVVMGGIHVSMLPEEAIPHCDSVVIGEAEEIWERVIRDAQKKNLQRFYYAPKLPDLANTPIPRWDLLKNNEYSAFTIYTGRGCPNDCEFCIVKEFFGRGCRHKSIEKVVEEVKFLQGIDPKKALFFTDDNLLVDSKYAEELMNRLKPLKINFWWCNTSMDMLKDDKILDLMYDSGCRMICIGFESLSQKSIDAMNKSHVNRVKEYKEIINRIHFHQIAILGSFILGNDTDDDTIFEETAGFINETNIAFPVIAALTPFAGTKLYKKLKSDNRILQNNWEKYNGESVCFKPNRLSAKMLEDKRDMVCKNIYGYDALSKRLSNLWRNKILINTKPDSRLLFTKPGGIISFLIRLFSGGKERKIFILKSLCKKNGFLGAASILLAISFHEYVYNSRK